MASGTFKKPTNALPFTVTLTTTWTNGAQDVLDSKFIADGYAYIVSPVGSSLFTDYSPAKIYADNVTVDGKMTFHCNAAPTNPITVNIIRLVAV